MHNLKQTATGYEGGEKKPARLRQTRGSSGVAGVQELSPHCRGSMHRVMANFPIFSLMELYPPLSIFLGDAHRANDEHRQIELDMLVMWSIGVMYRVLELLGHPEIQVTSRLAQEWQGQGLWRALQAFRMRQHSRDALSIAKLSSKHFKARARDHRDAAS